MGKVSKIWATSENLWYEELKVIHPYREYQYDRMIQLHLKTLFPEYHAVPYNRKITQKGFAKGSKPDFALIRKDFKEWWIIEVERIEDKLSHVHKQIVDFINGDYNSFSEAKYLAENCSLNYKDIYQATQNNPKVMLIVDDMNSKWHDAFKELDTTNCILKVYKNNKGLELYSISGDYPYIYEEESHCHFADAMNNLLQVTNPNVLTIEIEDKPMSGLKNKLKKAIKKAKDYWQSEESSDDANTFSITYKGQNSEWKKIEDTGKVYLQPIGPIAARANDSFMLKRLSRKKFILEDN
ncbi:hypothetical protein [Spongiimicrobium sp. 3-5]|uniref:hypothetical protein n=1 Tax=Spongiimicrobium sp. 3-5 TaxID=3332596 RepID=UPI00397F3B72